jgi:hypothetical protein
MTLTFIGNMAKSSRQRKEIADACQALKSYTADDILDYLKHKVTYMGLRRIRLPTSRYINKYLCFDTESECYRHEGPKRSIKRYKFIGEFKKVKH